MHPWRAVQARPNLDAVTRLEYRGQLLWFDLCQAETDHSDPAIGFLSHANMIQSALDQGKVLAPARSLEEMQRIIFNDRIDAALVGLFLAVVLAILYFTIRTCIAARRSAAPTAWEIPTSLAPAR